MSHKFLKQIKSHELWIIMKEEESCSVLEVKITIKEYCFVLVSMARAECEMGDVDSGMNVTLTDTLTAIWYFQI